MKTIEQKMWVDGYQVGLEMNRIEASGGARVTDYLTLLDGANRAREEGRSDRMGYYAARLARDVMDL